MASKFDDSQSPLLRREVLYPQRQNTGVGVMLVASAAMFFAVSSSAFILRAQMHQKRPCLHHSHTAPASLAGDANAAEINAVPVELISERAISPTGSDAMTTLESCAEPAYRRDADGSVSVTFDLCSGK